MIADLMGRKLAILFRQPLRFAIPTVAAACLFWLMLETKRSQGWHEFQDQFQHSAKPFLHYPTVEFSIVGAVIAIAYGFVLAGRPRIGAAVAFADLSFTYALFLGIYG